MRVLNLKFNRRMAPVAIAVSLEVLLGWWRWLKTKDRRQCWCRLLWSRLGSGEHEYHYSFAWIFVLYRHYNFLSDSFIRSLRVRMIIPIHTVAGCKTLQLSSARLAWCSQGMHHISRSLWAACSNRQKRLLARKLIYHFRREQSECWTAGLSACHCRNRLASSHSVSNWWRHGRSLKSKAHKEKILASKRNLHPVQLYKMKRKMLVSGLSWTKKGIVKRVRMRLDVGLCCNTVKENASDVPFRTKSRTHNTHCWSAFPSSHWVIGMTFCLRKFVDLAMRHRAGMTCISVKWSAVMTLIIIH